MKNFFVLVMILGLVGCGRMGGAGEQRELLADQEGSELAEMMGEIEEGDELLPIQIEYLRSREFGGVELKIEEELGAGSNYRRYIASYDSDGLKQYGLLTVPNGEVPGDGWPAIVFNHGYIDPDEYRTTERYVAYTDGFSRSGYVLFRPDYRGHDRSEGEAQGGYGNSDYIIDVLHAFVGLQNLKEVDADRVGMWGHSMGGWITHRAMVVNEDIRAGVIWAGMVGGYDDLLEVRQPNWVRRGIAEPTPDPDNPRRRWRRYLTEEYGEPSEDPEFWASISAVSYLDDLSGPIQLHHATGDESVPVELSERLFDNLEPLVHSISTKNLYNGLVRSHYERIEKDLKLYGQSVRCGP